MVSQRHVDDSTLVGGHRLQGDRTSAVGDPLGHPARHVGQGLVPAVLVPLHVHHELNIGIQLLAHHVLDEELKGLEGVPAAAYQEACVVALDLEHWAAQVFPFYLSEGGDDIHTQKGDDVFEDVGRGLDHVRWGVDAGHPDPGRFAADAEDTGLAAANDVDFGLGAIYV